MHFAAIRSTVLLCALGCPAPAQGEPAPAPSEQDLAAEDAAARARFAALSAEERDARLAPVLRRIQLEPDDRVQAVVSAMRSFRRYPLAQTVPFHRAEDWAKGVAPERTMVRKSDPAHAAARARFPVRAPLPGLRRAVFYDWRRGEIVRREQPLTAQEQFDNLLLGFAPGTDEALAHTLAVLDDDEKQRKVAAYLGHLYADLNARVYEGITLYDAWYSTEQLDVPDVDAIPFAVEILRTRRYRSPIPDGRGRTRLYTKIRDAAFAHRRYRTLRDAAAAALVAATPDIPPPYDLLVPRFHYLWSEYDHDREAIAEIVRTSGSREKLLTAVDAELSENDAAAARRDERVAALEAIATWLRAEALALVPER